MDQLDRIRYREYQMMSAEYFMGNKWSLKSYIKQSELNRSVYRLLDIVDSESGPKFITERCIRHVSREGQYYMQWNPTGDNYEEY